MFIAPLRSPQAMSFSSRRRNYLLAPHRRDGLIEWYHTRKSRNRLSRRSVSCHLTSVFFVVLSSFS